MKQATNLILLETMKTLQNILSKQTLVYELINTLNNKGLINDKVFFYLLDTLPNCLTYPNEVHY
jgi:hypothetical protein